MKRMMVFWLVCVLAGCGGGMNGAGEVVRMEIPGDWDGVSPQDSAVRGWGLTWIRKVVDEDSCLLAEYGSGTVRWPFSRWGDYEGVTFRRQPLKRFDLESFLEEPEAGRVMDCVREEENRVWFAGERNSRPVVLLDLVDFRQEFDDCSRGGFSSTWSWEAALVDSISREVTTRADGGEFCLLTCGCRLFWMYEVGGEVRFRNVEREMGVDDFARFVREWERLFYDERWKTRLRGEPEIWRKSPQAEWERGTRGVSREELRASRDIFFHGRGDSVYLMYEARDFVDVSRLARNDYGPRGCWRRTIDEWSWSRDLLVSGFREGVSRLAAREERVVRSPEDFARAVWRDCPEVDSAFVVGVNPVTREEFMEFIYRESRRRYIGLYFFSPQGFLRSYFGHGFLVVSTGGGQFALRELW